MKDDTIKNNTKKDKKDNRREKKRYQMEGECRREGSMREASYKEQEDMGKG